MRKNHWNDCEGCEYEFYEALEAQRRGLHYATSIDREYWSRDHFMIWMVDDDGKTMMW